MQEPIKFCSACGQQNNLSAQFCQKCGARYREAAPSPAPGPRISWNHPGLWVACGIVALMFFAVIMSQSGPESEPAKSAALMPSPRSATSTPADNAERMVLDNAQVTAYVECTNREYKQYKFRFVVKKPGSPLIDPIVRMAGISNPQSVVVNGVDTGDDLAFSPNIAVFDKNLKATPITYTRSLNGNEALGYAYHDLVVNYEKGN